MSMSFPYTESMISSKPPKTPLMHIFYSSQRQHLATSGGTYYTIIILALKDAAQTIAKAFGIGQAWCPIEPTSTQLWALHL